MKIGWRVKSGGGGFRFRKYLDRSRTRTRACESAISGVMSDRKE
jgi:hypothetical protein